MRGTRSRRGLFTEILEKYSMSLTSVWDSFQNGISVPLIRVDLIALGQIIRVTSDYFISIGSWERNILGESSPKGPPYGAGSFKVHSLWWEESICDLQRKISKFLLFRPMTLGLIRDGVKVWKDYMLYRLVGAARCIVYHHQLSRWLQTTNFTSVAKIVWTKNTTIIIHYAADSVSFFFFSQKSWEPPSTKSFFWIWRLFKDNGGRDIVVVHEQRRNDHGNASTPSFIIHLTIKQQNPY